MEQNNKVALQAASSYNAAITREQFLFYEVRTTAKLLHEGCSSEEVVERIISDNLFQYPTEKSVRKMALQGKIYRSISRCQKGQHRKRCWYVISIYT